VRIHVGGNRSKISGRWDWFGVGVSKLQVALSSALAVEAFRVRRVESTHSLERKVDIVRARREGYRYSSVILRGEAWLSLDLPRLQVYETMIRDLWTMDRANRSPVLEPRPPPLSSARLSGTALPACGSSRADTPPRSSCWRRRGSARGGTRLPRAGLVWGRQSALDPQGLDIVYRPVTKGDQVDMGDSGSDSDSPLPMIPALTSHDILWPNRPRMTSGRSQHERAEGAILLTRHIRVDSLGLSASSSTIRGHYTYLRVAAKVPISAQRSYTGDSLFALTLRASRVSHEISKGGARPALHSLSRPSISKIAYSIWARRLAVMSE
jgi:hypothetical protein